MRQGDDERDTRFGDAREGRTDRVTLHRERQPGESPAERPGAQPHVEHQHAGPQAPGDHRHSGEVRPDPAVIVVGKVSQGVVYLLGLLEGLLGLRLVFRAIAANPASPITQFIYGVTDPLLEPFRGLVANPSANGHVLELTTIIAMLVYLLLFLAIVHLLRLIVTPPRL